MTPRPRFVLPLLAGLALAPRPVLANPTAVAALPTIAIATEPGVAEAVVPPQTGSTTRVTVEVAPSPLETVTAPEPVPPPDPELSRAYRYRAQAHDDRKSGRGLLTSGVSVAISAYALTSLAGAMAIDRARDFEDDPLTEPDESLRGDQRRAFGRALLIPGIGPAIAIHRSDSAVRAWAAGVSGLAQALGVGLVLLGTHRLARAHRLERLAVSASGDRLGAQVSLRVRF